jgi:3-hydroxyisobutyrate dehydrogenase-like beta-hydroxyacid dehydrogenase
MMSNGNRSKTVSVIGTGNMGSALAEALLTTGFAVTVWNRTVAKAELLVEKGAVLAGSPVEAALKSERTIVCVTDQDAYVSIIHNDSVATALEGKRLIQLGVVTAAETLETANWAHAHGIGYLEGSILGLPINVVAGEATIVCSGSREQYDQQKPMLETFGITHHLSSSIGAAYQFDKTLYPFGCGAYLGFIQGAAMAKASGYSIEVYTSILLEWMKPLAGKLENFGNLIRKEEFTAQQASLEVWVDVYEKSMSFCQSLEVDDTLLKAHVAMLRRAVTEGYGDEEIIAIYKTLLPK